jgi:hypothetical protein
MLKDMSKGESLSGYQMCETVEESRKFGDALRERLLPFGWFEWHGPESVWFVTDHAGSVPLYYAQERGRVLAGKTPLEVAGRMTETVFDPVSVADFLLNGTVCYPYTLFKGVYVAPPGAVTEVTPTQIHSETFYLPEEEESGASVDEWGSQLREQVQHALLAGVEGKRNVKVLFSGGEDSRAVVSLLPEEMECELVTFADGYNREVRLAERAARALRRPWIFIKRSENFYRQDISERCLAIGGSFDILHTHVWGDLALSLQDADVLIGGFTADTLFKSLWMGNVDSKIKRFGPERLQHIVTDHPVGIENTSKQVWLDPGIAAAVQDRRMAHHQRIKEFRPVSTGNWHNLWPLGSQQPHYAHYLASRLACSEVVEPFLSPQVYRLAAAMPDRFRVDRKAFREAFARTMAMAGWLPTSSGGIPRLGGHLGHWVRLGALASWRARDRITAICATMTGLKPITQDAWSLDQLGFLQDFGKQLTAEQREQIHETLSVVLTPAELDKFFDPNGATAPVLVRNRALQLAHLI